MPKLLFARPPMDAVEERKIRKLAGARHAPADWIRRAQMVVRAPHDAGLDIPRDLAVVGSGDIEDAATPARHSPRSPRASGRSPSVRWIASPNIWTATGPTRRGTSSYRTAWSSE